MLVLKLALAVFRVYFIPSQPDGTNLIYSAAELDFPPLKSLPLLSEDPCCRFTALARFHVKPCVGSLGRTS